MKKFTGIEEAAWQSELVKPPKPHNLIFSLVIVEKVNVYLGSISRNASRSLYVMNESFSAKEEIVPHTVGIES